MINLPKEITDILHTQDGSVRVVDPETNKTYLVVDEAAHKLVMQALQEQELLKSLENAVVEADNGGGLPLEDADKKLRQELGFPPRS